MMVARVLDFEEGFSSVPYLCSEDYVTIGLGTKIHSEKGQDPSKFLLVIDRETAYEWLKREVKNVEDRILRGSHAETYRVQPLAVQHIILSMGYQLGYSGLYKFKKMWKRLDVHDYEGAAREALDSQWAKQTPERAARHAEVIRVRNMSPYAGLIEGVV